MEIVIIDDLSPMEEVTIMAEGYYLCSKCGERLPQGVKLNNEIKCVQCGWTKNQHKG